MRINVRSSLMVAVAVLGSSSVHASGPQTAAFTYQGLLKFNGQPATTTYDFSCRMFDAEVGGNQVGSLITPGSIEADDDGRFTMELDFGALAFDGQERWLELGVRESGSGDPFTTLAPRQKLASAPYAAFALHSALSGTYASSVNFNNAGNQFAGSFSGTGAGLTDINPANLASGTAGISITGNAATATSAGNVTGVVAIVNGGTGASNAAAARTNLGAAATSHTHAAADIASGNLNVLRMPTGGAWSLSSSLNVDSDTLLINPATNRVGIGTAAPAFPFEVAMTPPGDNLNPVALFRMAGASSSVGAIRVQNSAGNHFNLGIAQNNDFALNYNLNISQASDLLRITPAGNLGLGSTAPEARLHVNMADTGNAVVLLGAPLMLESMADNWISMMTDAADLSGIAFGRPGSTLPDLLHGAVVYNDALSDGMEFRTGGNFTRMAISGAGNVGIGTTSAAAALNVYEPDESTLSNLFLGDVARAGVLITTDLTTSAYTPGVFWNTLNDNPTKPKGGIYLNTGSTGSTMHFSTSNSYSSGLSTAALSIDSDSDVGIGTLFPDAQLSVRGGNASTPVLDVLGSAGAEAIITAGGDADVTITGGFGGGDVVLEGGQGDGSVIISGGSGPAGGNVILSVNGVGKVWSWSPVGVERVPSTNAFEVEGAASKTTSGSWLANSDARIKTDVESVEDALDTLEQVRLVSFRYSPPYLQAHSSIEDRRYLNVIAQEFAEVFPDHVKGSGEFLKSGEEILQVDIHPLTIYSAAAIQELHEKAKEQEKEIELLKQQHMQLQEGFESLKDDLKDRDRVIADLVGRLEAVEKHVRQPSDPTPR